MPLYDYRCEACGLVAEFAHPMNSPLHSCPQCGSSQFHKIVGAVAINSHKGSDSDLHKLQQYESTRPVLPGKRRVEKLLNDMKPDVNNTSSGSGSCVEHTRQELRERYGNII